MPKKILSMSADGKPVLRLPGGKVEPLAQTQAKESQVFLLLDCSSSMEGSKLIQAQNGSLEFADKALSSGYAVGLISFGSSAEVLSELSLNLSALRESVQELNASGSTNMTAGIELAVEELTSRNGARAIVLVTDGAPDDRGSAIRAAEHAKASGIDIITIGTDDADIDFLRQLASRTDLAIDVSKKMLADGISAAAKLLPP